MLFAQTTRLSGHGSVGSVGQTTKGRRKRKREKNIEPACKLEKGGTLNIKVLYYRKLPQRSHSEEKVLPPEEIRAYEDGGNQFRFDYWRVRHHHKEVFTSVRDSLGVKGASRIATKNNDVE